MTKKHKRNTQEVQEAAFLGSSLNHIEKLTAAVFLHNKSNGTLAVILKSARLCAAFQKFMTDAVLLFFYQTLMKLNNSSFNASWTDKANSIYEYYMSPRTVHELYISKDVRSTMYSLYEDPILAGDQKQQFNEKKLQLLYETFKRAEKEAEVALCNKIPTFIKSHPYYLW